MMIKHVCMSWWRVALVGLVLGACTSPNPRSCSDGTCTDPALPFCDVDGAIAGSPQTCIAVTCTPEEFKGCRGDQAIKCNATGNDFDLVQCQLGCDAAAGGCVACTSDDQCDNPSPICDLGAGECRTCRSDDECASKVCDTSSGACLAEASIVYATPTGVDSGPCTQAAPCSLDRAVAVATTAVAPPTLRMLPGTFVSPLDVHTPTPTPLSIVATAAILNSPTVGGMDRGLVAPPVRGTWGSIGSAPPHRP